MPISEQGSIKFNVRARLFELIQKLSDDQLLIVLKKIEGMHFKENRKELRKRCPLSIDFRVQEHEAKGVVHDISYSGVFIETMKTFVIGSEISLEFSFQGLQNPIKIIGEIARKTPRGIGVRFRNLSKFQEDVIKSLVDSR